MKASFDIFWKTSVLIVVLNFVFVGGAVEDVEINSKDCRMPHYRCSRPYALVVKCFQSKRGVANSRKELQAACKKELELKRRCNNYCNVHDGVNFNDYEYIWNNPKNIPTTVYTTAELHKAFSTPDDVKYSYYNFCSYEDRKVQIYLENDDLKDKFDQIFIDEHRVIGSSRHASLALDPDTCLIKSNIDYSGKGLSFFNDCARVVSIPTFILPVWSITNVFHLYADLIFPLMNIFYKRYGKTIPENNLIFIETCHEWQNGKIQRIMRGDYSAFGDSPVQVLLKIASNNNKMPVFAKSHLDELKGRTCFMNDLHIGTLNIDTSLDFGLSNSVQIGPEEALMKVDDYYLNMKGQVYVQDLEKRFKIQRWSMEYIITRLFSGEEKQTNEPNLVVVIERHGTREIINQKQLDVVVDKILAKNKVAWKGIDMLRVNVALEKKKFTDQLRMFQRAAILITVHGQGAANSIFLPSKCTSAMILIMPKTWFGWRFLYANMALSNGVHVIMYRRPEDNDIDGYDGTGNNDLVNPYRDLNMTLDENVFRASFVNAVRLVGNNKKSKKSQTAVFPKCVGCYY